MHGQNPPRACAIALPIALLAACATDPDVPSYDRLRAGFRDPPAAARPDAFWPWLNGHADPARMTEEMEAFQAVGFSSLQVWDVKAHQDPEQVVPLGPPFLSDAWLVNLAHADREARRLGLELGMLAASGWNAGGTWVPPEQAGLALYASRLEVRGPAALDQQLEFPAVADRCPRGADGLPAYWRTVAVQALPVTESFDPTQVVDLTARLGPDHRLRWDAPPGAWTLRWLVFANTGQQLIVPSPGSAGLQIDFFDADDTRAYFTHVLDRLESALGPLEESALRYLEVDSLELTVDRLAAWTEDILDAFEESYGYDPRPWLTLLLEPTRAGDRGARFLHDWTRLISDLMVENHYRLGNALLRERGLLLAAEAGGPGPPIWHSCPVDALGALGAVGLVRGEFWAKQRSMYNVKEIACAAHTYGKTLVDAESFTSWRHWRDGPYYLKLLADQAFLDGLNHITFHTAPHGGTGRGLPGYAYHAGTHMGPNLCWWPMARPFIDYLSRCSFLLQQGQPVADVLFYQGDGAPAFHPLAVDWDPRVRPAGHDYDVVDVRVLCNDLSVEDRRLVLPHGVGYELLVLPEDDAIDPAALRRIAELVDAGATVVGPRPNRASGLADQPQADARVRTLAAGLWGDIDGVTVTEHRVGRGRVLHGTELLGVLGERPPDFAWEGGDSRTRLGFVHRRHDDLDVYFVVNQHERWEQVDTLFRVTDRVPEIWNPDTGQTLPVAAYRREGSQTRVPLRLPPGGAAFVLFVDDPGAPAPRPLAPHRPLPRVRSATAPDLAHGAVPNGPCWVSAGEQPADREFLVFDLGAVTDLDHAWIWNFQDQARGLLTRGLRTVDVSVAATDTAPFEPLTRLELDVAPDIGERDYQQQVPLTARGVRYVRFDVVANHSTDWSGHTDVVGLNKITFHTVGGANLEQVRVDAFSSGTAQDPCTDPLRALRRNGHPLTGPWEVHFEARRGAQPRAVFDELHSWTTAEDTGIRHFSGIATYVLRFELDAGMLAADDTCITLDLGRVAGVARVHLNGEDLGVVWKPPYTVEVTGHLQPGDNELRCEVANTWHNRLVGDASLPVDERITQTNIRRSFTPKTPLLEAGLLGPVQLIPRPTHRAAER